MAKIPGQAELPGLRTQHCVTLGRFLKLLALVSLSAERENNCAYLIGLLERITLLMYVN